MSQLSLRSRRIVRNRPLYLSQLSLRSRRIPRNRLLRLSPRRRRRLLRQSRLQELKGKLTWKDRCVLLISLLDIPQRCFLRRNQLSSSIRKVCQDSVLRAGSHIPMPGTAPTRRAASHSICLGLGPPNATKPSITTSGMSASSASANSGSCT